MAYKVSIVIEKNTHGYYAYCPELEGCQTQGNTLEEVLSNIKGAIELYLETFYLVCLYWQKGRMRKWEKWDASLF